VVEDLGGGLQAIGQYDFRGTLDVGGLTAAGNDHVGLRSKTWGRIIFGRQDLHWFVRPSDMTNKASIRTDVVSILSYAGGGGQVIANGVRTANVVHYTTPNWSGFSAIVAYSSNSGGQDADLGLVGRKGRAWNFNPSYQAANWQVAYSYWNTKNDLGTAANTIAGGDQRSDRLSAYYRFGMGLKVGLAYDNSRIRGAFGGTTLSKRSAWSLPIEYSWGPHNLYFHYDRASRDKSAATDAGSVQALNGDADSRATMWALAYAYDLSKRTSVALSYARINNRAGAAYNLFTSATHGLANVPVANGEDPSMWGVTLRHQF
jgi:predicted porin